MHFKIQPGGGDEGSSYPPSRLRRFGGQVLLGIVTPIGESRIFAFLACLVEGYFVGFEVS